MNGSFTLTCSLMIAKFGVSGDQLGPSKSFSYAGMNKPPATSDIGSAEVHRIEQGQEPVLLRQSDVWGTP